MKIACACRQLATRLDLDSVEMIITADAWIWERERKRKNNDEGANVLTPIAGNE